MQEHFFNSFSFLAFNDSGGRIQGNQINNYPCSYIIVKITKILDSPYAPPNINIGRFIYEFDFCKKKIPFLQVCGPLV